MKLMRVPFVTLHQELTRVLIRVGFEPKSAELCARLFAETDRDGVYSHGLNRFPRFLDYIRKGYVAVQGQPRLVTAMGSLEVWDGQFGPGNLNATAAMQRAIELAQANGIACVAMRDTNHWMRGGTYGWQAADAGLVGICFTNTTPNMPPWGGTTPGLGNNPLILAVPRANGQHVVLDMAMSQFSYGKLQVMGEAGKTLPVPGGYDVAGQLTQDANAIAASGRVLPIGFWKGAGLSLMLDLLAAVLSGGKTTAAIGAQPDEYGVSQVFIAMKPGALSAGAFEETVEAVISFARASEPEADGEEIFYPGERVWRTRQQNLAEGIPVDADLWEKVLTW